MAEKRKHRPTIRAKDPEDNKKPAKDMKTLEDGCWWLENEQLAMAEKIRTVLERNWRSQEFARTEMAMSWRLYENTPIAGLTPRLYRPRSPNSRINRIAWNIVKSCVDTYVSLIVKEVPKVSFVTSGGNRALQIRAKKLEKFVRGVRYENRVAQLSQQIVRDSATFGFGLVKVYADYDNPKKPKIRIERQMPWNDHTDEQDAHMGKPQSKQLTTWVDKRALAAEYPGQAEEILRTNTEVFMDAGAQDVYGMSANNVFCLLTESWHLPRVPGKEENGGTGDGRHVLSVGSVILVDEPWTRADFGLVYLYRQRPIAGIWAQSLPSELAPIQVSIAKTLHNISLGQRRAVGHWMVENNSEINTGAMDDRYGSIFRYTGVEPSYKVFQTVAPDVYDHLEKQWQRGFEVIGISQNMAASEIPAQLQSGKAQMVYSEKQAERFVPCYREYQEWTLELAHAIITVAREIADNCEDFCVQNIQRKDLLQTVKWADAHLEEDEFCLELYPTNALADDPAARDAQVQEWMNSGLVSQEVGKRLLDMPDLEEENAYEFAAYDFTMRCADKALDEGKFIGPSPVLEDYIPQAIAMMRKVYLKGRNDDVPDKRLALILRWIATAETMIEPPPMDPNQPPPPDGQPPTPGGPPGLPQGIPGAVQERLQKGVAQRTASQLQPSK